MPSPKTTKSNPQTAGASSPTTSDDFLGGRITVLQPKKGHRSGSDAVWLQAAVPAKKGESVLDAGSGVGVAGLCLLARVQGTRVTAVEIESSLSTLAETNAASNGLSGRFTAIETDLTAQARSLTAKGLVAESYDQVMANPPYHAEGSVRITLERASAHVMNRGGLEAWIRFLVRMMAAKATLTLIHLPERLPDLLSLLEGRCGGITIFPLFPTAGAAASRIIVQARKGSRAPLRLLPGLVLHRADGAYTAQAEAVLREGQGLELDR
jgi:tRNA1(Val) A37 N6-methylase TrmN6